MVTIFAALVLWSCGGDRDAMRERMAYVSQCNRADTVFTEAWLPTVDSLVRFFDLHGNANERMMAHYLQGRVHHDMGETPIALECYQKATEMADTTRRDCDLRTLILFMVKWRCSSTCSSCPMTRWKPYEIPKESHGRKKMSLMPFVHSS